MENNHYYYWCLHSYLSRADEHYVEGRSLWLQWMYDGASILLWMSVEQMIKLLITQSKIETGSLEKFENKDLGLVVHDPLETDIKRVHALIDKEFYRIGSRHKLDGFKAQLLDVCGIDLSPYLTALEKLEEYFIRRYVQHNGSSLSGGNIEIIDEVYFLLRSKLDARVPMAYIDEIAWQKKVDGRHPAPYFPNAYIRNKHFASREHPVVNQALGDGRIIAVDGVKDRMIIDFDDLKNSNVGSSECP